MEPGLAILLITFTMIVLVLILGSSSGNRRTHSTQEEFAPPSALKRIIYSRPACAEAVGVYKFHNERVKLRKQGCGVPSS